MSCPGGRGLPAPIITSSSNRAPRTPPTLTAVDDILRGLQGSRRLGYAVDGEELFLGDMGIAAPVVDRFGQAVGAMHISPPTSRRNLEEETSSRPVGT